MVSGEGGEGGGEWGGGRRVEGLGKWGDKESESTGHQEDRWRNRGAGGWRGGEGGWVKGEGRQMEGEGRWMILLFELPAFMHTNELCCSLSCRLKSTPQ